MHYIIIVEFAYVAEVFTKFDATIWTEIGNLHKKQQPKSQL